MKTFRHLILLALLGAPLLPAADPQNGFVGSDACKTCHADVWSSFYKNPHSKIRATEKDHPERTGCESCHGPGGNHVAQKGGKATIIAFSQLAPGKILDACLACHKESLSRSNIDRSSHTLAEVVCTSCHSVHKSATPRNLLAKQETALCYTCHADVKAQFAMPFKHRVEEGFMSCSDCHNPHGTFAPTWSMGSRPRMTDVAVNEEPCLKCHADKRGPFVFEHAAVRVEGCERCHSPHGSTNSRLLSRPVVFTMCLECHNGAGSFGRETTSVFKTPSTHNMADPRYQNCTSCHVRIHGSNADATFLR